jgi:hypothetical protein
MRITEDVHKYAAEPGVSEQEALQKGTEDQSREFVEWETRFTQMCRVLLERAAEKDLSRLSSEIHGRVIAAIQALARNPRPPGRPPDDGG